MKTSELTGAALDWAVAKCEAEAVELISARMITERRHVSLTPEEVASLPAPKPYLVIPGVGNAAYSTNWAQGGPIIEREQLSVEPQYTAGGLECWVAYGHNLRYDDHGNYIQGSDNRQYAPTPLIAAMRCYVASKMGDEIEIPEELQ